MRVALISGLLAMTLVGLGCDGGNTIDNKGYCQEVCAAKQAESCMEDIHLDCEHEATCPITWNEDGLDYTAYIDCEYGRYQCDDQGEFEYVDADCVQPSAE